MDIDFSVIIPAYTEAIFLESTLQSIRDQDFDGSVELIVVADDSSEEAAHVARDYADLVLYHPETLGAAAARQHGARRARGANLVFLDADNAMSPNLLREAARSLRAGYVGGRAPIQFADQSFGARCTEVVVNGWRRFIGPIFIPYFYCTREAFMRAGGWDLHNTCAPEVRLQQRVRQYGKLAWDRSGRTRTEALGAADAARMLASSSTTGRFGSHPRELAEERCRVTRQRPLPTDSLMGS